MVAAATQGSPAVYDDVLLSTHMVQHLAIGDHFNPEVGFVRRDDMRRSFGQFRFSPRPKGNKYVRKYFWSGTYTNIENGTGRLESRTMDTQTSRPT